ncbi:hypothetical protein MKZ38_009945 [Zalerion maritima]|uniref:Phosphatidate phosphatase APP1 catalytic domain-containing protein n=1 Tax=Zalerion maritima TaxID=339359 RepID=A0AAD5RGJ5_9PEZI|nr:hypothetical protein MKZ38_009945 [Zalerion maritima]
MARSGRSNTSSSSSSDNRTRGASSSAKAKLSPKQLVQKMQQKTRRKQGFADFESAIPDPKTAAMLAIQPSGLFSYLRHLATFQTQVSSRDTVWLLDNTAFRDPKSGQWCAEFVSAVFAQDPSCKVVDIVSSVAKLVGLAEDANAVRTIERRIVPFLLDTLPGRKVEVLHGFRDKKRHRAHMTLGATSINGISSDVVTLPSAHHGHNGGDRIPEMVSAPRGADGILESRTVCAEPEGWAVLSDVDDTIKITMTSDPVGILKTTFVEQPEPVPGMPQLYAKLRSMLPRDSPFFYLSASPYNLYPFLRDFRDEWYPPGTMILRDSSWKTISGLLTNLTVGTDDYKEDRVSRIHSWFPMRKMICIGDSTQSDPEVYGECYRRFPGWMKLILIRRVTDIAAVGIEEKNDNARFEEAFKGVPREAWHVFDHPEECAPLLAKLGNSFLSKFSFWLKSQVLPESPETYICKWRYERKRKFEEDCNKQLRCKQHPETYNIIEAPTRVLIFSCTRSFQYLTVQTLAAASIHPEEPVLKQPPFCATPSKSCRPPSPTLPLPAEPGRQDLQVLTYRLPLHTLGPCSASLSSHSRLSLAADSRLPILSSHARLTFRVSLAELGVPSPAAPAAPLSKSSLRFLLPEKNDQCASFSSDSSSLAFSAREFEALPPLWQRQAFSDLSLFLLTCPFKKTSENDETELEEGCTAYRDAQDGPVGHFKLPLRELLDWYIVD